MWGLSDASTYWGAVLKLYDQEKLDGAYQLAKQLGEGSAGKGLSVFRLIESEYEASRRGHIRELSPWLTLQYIPEEIGGDIDAICAALRQLAAEEQSRFGWTEALPVRVTILSRNEDAWWATSRFGYCTEKVPFFKICIPSHAVRDPRRFVQVFRHEFGHVISLSITKGRLASWLGEGFSVYAAGEYSQHALNVFLRNPPAWLEPRTLDLRFGPGLDLADPAKWLAYQQGGIIVHYLVGLKGEAALMAMLRDHADESFWRNAALLFGGSRTDSALRKIYGKTEEELFELSRP